MESLEFVVRVEDGGGRIHGRAAVLMAAAARLLALHIKSSDDGIYCLQCSRVGLGDRHIDHAESCLVGNMVRALREFGKPSSERTPIFSGAEIAGWRSMDADRHIEYEVEGYPGVSEEGSAPARCVTHEDAVAAASSTGLGARDDA